MSSVAYLLLWTAGPPIPTKARRGVYGALHPRTAWFILSLIGLHLLWPHVNRVTELDQVLPRWTALH